MGFKQYISHPARSDDEEPTLLIGHDGVFDDDGHLRTVADRMVDACGEGQLADGTPAKIVAEVIGLTHDFAKLTSWAQMYLRGQPFQRSKEYRYHSFPSALVTLYCLKVGYDDITDHAAEVATLVVLGHHNTSSPPDPARVAERYGRLTNVIAGKYERVNQQFDDINEVSELADRVIRSATNGAGSWEDFLQWNDRHTDPIDGAHEHLRYFAEMDGEHRDEYYTDVLRLWTALKFADQTAASGLEDSDLEGYLPSQSDLAEHIDGLDKGTGVLAELNRLRDRARRDVVDNVDSLIESDDVGLITLPTGFGKTYAGLSAGLKAAASKDSRLVYVLPYTSILDQTAREIQSIFDVSPYSKAFTLHHHLSETYTGLDGRHTDSDIGRSPGSLHAESWLSGLTLTTTVQLFESLTAPTARQASRIPSLDDSVVVIDEPQAIPEDWWQIVPVLIELLIKRFNATVILMTATQPGLIKYGSTEVSAHDLTDDTGQYVDFLDQHPRVIYRLHDSVRTKQGADAGGLDYQTAARHVLEATSDGSDVLAVCNTRASAEDLYQHVRGLTEDSEGSSIELGRLLHAHVAETGELPTAGELRQLTLDAAAEKETETVLAFLSGNVRPDDRSVIIDALYDDTKDNSEAPDPLLDTSLSVILISTSVVEAGVDISFNTVFRDYAPIPNIVQSGGRCNRAFDGEIGEVVIWRLAEPEDGNSIPSLVIHGGSGGDTLPLLQATGQVLREYTGDQPKIDEAVMISDVVSDFYHSLFEGPLDPGNKKLVTDVESVAMSELENEHMIDDIEDYEDVIIGLTDKERVDFFASDIDIGTVSKYPGAQVSTDPESWMQEISIGNSRYLVLDGRDTSYDPVFGVR